jgi:hypothetical protein
MTINNLLVKQHHKISLIKKMQQQHEIDNNTRSNTLSNKSSKQGKKLTWAPILAEYKIFTKQPNEDLLIIIDNDVIDDNDKIELLIESNWDELLSLYNNYLNLLP